MVLASSHLAYNSQFNIESRPQAAYTMPDKYNEIYEPHLDSPHIPPPAISPQSSRPLSRPFGTIMNAVAY